MSWRREKEHAPIALTIAAVGGAVGLLLLIVSPGPPAEFAGLGQVVFAGLGAGLGLVVGGIVEVVIRLYRAGEP
jgi:hypothetical protein